MRQACRAMFSLRCEHTRGLPAFLLRKCGRLPELLPPEGAIRSGRGYVLPALPAACRQADGRCGHTPRFCLVLPIARSHRRAARPKNAPIPDRNVAL